jgi:hypothetical protein
MSYEMCVPYMNIAPQHAPIKEKILAAIGGIIDHGRFILGDEVAEVVRLPYC